MDVRVRHQRKLSAKSFWTVVLEKTPESPLDCKEIQPVNPKGNQSRIFIARTDAEAETLILWPPDVKNWLMWKDPDAGKDWGQEEKGTTEGEMVGWHHRLNGHGFGWTPGVGDGQGGLVCCSSWGRKESAMTEWLNWTDAGKDWRWEEKGMTEDEMIVCHHQLNGHEFEQASGVGDGQESLVCCSPWGRKESDTTEWLNWTEPQISDARLLNRQGSPSLLWGECICHFPEQPESLGLLATFLSSLPFLKERL